MRELSKCLQKHQKLTQFELTAWESQMVRRKAYLVLLQNQYEVLPQYRLGNKHQYEFVLPHKRLFLLFKHQYESVLVHANLVLWFKQQYKLVLPHRDLVLWFKGYYEFVLPHANLVFWFEQQYKLVLRHIDLVLSFLHQ